MYRTLVPIKKQRYCLFDSRDEEMIEAGFLGTSWSYWNAIDEANRNFTPGIGFKQSCPGAGIPLLKN